MGGKNQTTTSSQTYTPAGLSQLQDIWGKVQGAASQPYTPYGGQLVAGLDPTQTAGVANTNAAVGTAQPYFDQAAQYATQGASTIDPSQIQKYLSPYNQDVINATQANFNESNAQQQQQVLGNAAAQGALGGDRVKIGQAELARQQNLSQAPVIAGLNNQNYTQALQAAQADRSAAGQGAFTFGALAPAIQNTALQGAGAQLSAGSVPQQNQQQQLSAQYQQFLQQQAFPYQQAQFLASYGLPAAQAYGGNQQGTTTTPGPSPWGQVAGLGLTAASFLKDGGRVNGYAGGGDVSPYNFMDAQGYIPKSPGQLVAQQIKMGAAPTPGGQQSTGLPSNAQLAGGLSGLSSFLSRPSVDPVNMGGGQGSLDGMDNDRGWARGGSVGHDLARTVHSIRGVLRSTGGAVNVPMGPYTPQGYDLGGNVDLPFADRAMPVQDAIANGTFDPQGANNTSFTQAPEFTSPQISGPLPQARPDAPMVMANDAPTSPMADLPPQITNPDNVPQDDANSAMAYSGAPASLSPAAAPTAGANARAKNIFGGDSLFNLSDDARMGIRAAGLGMLASKSPFALTQIGEGGLQGLQTYAQQKKQTQDQANTQQHIDLEAKKFAQSAEQFAKNYGLHQQTANDTAEYHKGLLEKQRTPSGYARNPDGTMSPVKGGPADPEIIQSITKAKQGAAMPDETADFLAERVLNGDNKALVGLGRGAQGAENLTKIQTLVAKKAADRGMNPQDILEKVAEASGLNAQQRTFGTQTAKMAVNATEAQGAIDLGRKASEGVPRGNWVPVNRVIQAYQSGTSDPALAKFGAANLAIVNTYARAINPTGVPHAADKEHAMALLSTATGPEAYNALLDQLNAEINIAHSAAPKAKQELEDIRKGKKPQDAWQAAATPSRVRQNGHTYERQSDGSMKAID